MACDAHDYTADVRDRAEAAIAAVAELVEAVRDVYGDDCEQVCETSCPTCRLRRAIAKFGGAACTLRDAHPAPQQPADKARAAAYRDCCDTPAYCSSVRRCTAKDGKQPDAKAYAG